MKNKSKFFAIILHCVSLCVILCLMTGCAGSQTNPTLEEYSRVLAKIQELEKLASDSYFHQATAEELKEMYSIGKEMYYDYDPMNLTPEQSSACEKLKDRVAHLKERIVSQVEAQISQFKVTVFCGDDELFETIKKFPVYLKKGEELNFAVNAEKPITVKVYNVDSRKVIRTHSGKKNIKDTMTMKNTAIYLVEIMPGGSQYLDYEIKYKIADMARLCDPTPVKSEQVECSKGDFGAVAVPGVTMRKLFEEPRKFTLRGQLKAAFSGSAIALVPVQVPSGATDILYSMRISTSESSKNSDGSFHDNLHNTYTKVKFLGLPLYEKSRNEGNSLLGSLLDDNRPYREEDAYCNMYVFRNQAQAKKFQDATKMASELNYDVDWSTLGTQSCTGRIPVNGSKTIYLAFENERIRYTNYLWVEAEAIVPNKVYYTTRYFIE